jgi:hypothetical protein
MANEKLFCRVMDNHPGAGCYWQVMRQDQIMASGLATTHAAAVVQAGHSKHELERDSTRQYMNRFGRLYRYNNRQRAV